MAAAPVKSTPLVDTEPTNTPDKFSYKHATFEEVLEDLSSRFILNLPEDELAEVERVCFQVEQAHWYYEDFIRDENPSFASLPLKKFSEILFRSCPLLHHWSHDHETAFNGFMSYKTRVPVCGAIMLNETLTKCVLVKGWKSSAGWGFPKGKVNENEDEAFCAVREVLEETGYNLNGQIRRSDCIRLCVKQQPITLFVVAGVPEDFPFKTQTRKEISKIDWFKLADLPTWKKSRSSTNKFYLITPVIGPLKAIVRNLRKTRKETKPQLHALQVADAILLPEVGDGDEDECPGTMALVESLATTGRETTSQSQSGEAEISSSQSSSIDPHTPSVNGDLIPHSSGDTLTFKRVYAEVDGIAMDTDKGISVTPSGLSADPRTHWSRLMTRLNHSEENSPQGTPQASTRTPPIAKSPPKPRLQPPNTSLPSQRPTVVGSNPSGPLELVEAPKDGELERPLGATRLSSISSSSIGSERLTRMTSSSLPPRGLPMPSASLNQLSSSPDMLVKRTRQLQLLDSVVAEDSRRSPRFAPPLSAHTLGAYPRPSSMVIPDQVRAPLRSASVNPEARGPFAPYHHHKHSVPSISGVLPSSTSTSSQHQVFSSSHDHPPRHQPIILPPGRGSAPTVSGGRPATAVPPQLHLPLQPHPASRPLGSPLAPYGRNVDSLHKGQMLSILSGARSSTIGTNRNSASPSSHGSCSSASTSTITTNPVTPAPRGNPNLLSILNNPSPTRSGHLQDRSSPANARQGG